VSDWSYQQRERDQKHEQLLPKIRERATLLPVDSLGDLLEEMYHSDMLGSGYRLLSVPVDAIDREDIGPIAQALTSVYQQRTGRAWTRKPDTSWQGPFASATVGSLCVGEPLVARPVPSRPQIRLQLLEVFSLFCGRGTREEVVELAMSHIRREVLGWEQKGYRRWFIGSLVWWHSVLCVIEVCEDAVSRRVRWFEPIIRLFELILRFKGGPPPGNTC
jgi:hypothetical protein